MKRPTATCRECDWTCDASSEEPEDLAEAAVALEDHLAGAHDLSYPRAHEVARSWARDILFAADPDTSAPSR